ncbi:hypothetical protein BDP55DRAFT_631819 [Colletotrichum godetiae]|uniref:Uncharacterized protein n=1 Tax=Colletotrichum godetiae TaxID=1209918 RepID=A0AAJ0ALV8_9PEZI|nr:uncharacterized protein BDP55DRAFT_631819 [Colletotrichum godetiae]KAK1675620.1 hypothetical protein BDP55DRAFT_631819 [Colletotrichum godetiae]
MDISTAIRQLATSLIDLELDNIRARSKFLDHSTCDPVSIGVHVYNDVGGQHFLSYDTSSPLPRETGYLSEFLSTRDHELQQTIRSLSHDGLLALHECLSREMDEMDDQARSDDGAEGPSPLSELNGLENDKRTSHLSLRKKIQEVSRAKMFRLSTSPLIANQFFGVFLIYLDGNGESILQKSSWPVWTDYKDFIETMSEYHYKVTNKKSGGVENIKQTYLERIDDFIEPEPAPPRIALARTYQTWFNNLDTMDDEWAYVTVDA